MTNARAFQRLWDKVDTGGDCWLYMGGSKVKGGYRAVHSHREDGRVILKLAHRVVLEAIYGPLPEGIEARHLCRNANCIHPDHLIPGTRKQNEADKDSYRLTQDRRRTRLEQ